MSCDLGKSRRGRSKIYQTLLLTDLLLCCYSSLALGVPIYAIPMNTTLRLIAGLAGTAVVFGSLAVATAKEPGLNSAKMLQQLSSVPNPELPAKAATLALIDQSETRQKSTEMIVGTAVDLNPVAAPMIVSSVSKLSPDMATTAAVAAAARQPKQGRAIAKAAASAAPSQALKVVSAMCKAQPGEYRAISIAVADAIPRMDRSIISAVIEAVPTLKPFFIRTSKVFAQDRSVSVAMFMEQISRDIESSAKALNMTSDTVLAAGIAPSQQSLLPSPPGPPHQHGPPPPFTPGAGHPGETNRHQPVEVTPGQGRN